MKLYVLLLLACYFCSSESCTWVRDDRCYYVVQSSLPFWSAETECQLEYGGNLVDIDSEDEDNFLRTNLLDKYIDSSTVTDPFIFWTGGYWNDNNKQWEWTKGNIVSYSNWLPGEPDSIHLYSNVGISYWWDLTNNAKFEWADHEDTTAYWFICESDL